MVESPIKLVRMLSVVAQVIEEKEDRVTKGVLCCTARKVFLLPSCYSKRSMGELGNTLDFPNGERTFAPLDEI